ncbi:transmembrane protein 120A-like [Brachyhypopomus gauderio]|uniref:transmembrane protein 120A-like n=1 Tax=Brachyhypopomus gauderio TaxID=698409 RepID=UPI004042B035
MSATLTEALQEWESQQNEFLEIQENHRLYMQKLSEVSKLQGCVSDSIAQQRKKLKEFLQSLRTKGLTEKEARHVEEMKERIQERQKDFSQMETLLPKKNGLYLSLVIGNVNVNLLSKQLKAAYKDEYEKFKLCVTVIMLLLTFSCLFLVTYRFLDAVLNFLLLWYYCTLTVRESVLISNGSRIKGWWVVHHYITAFLSGVMLTWPDGELYQMFRSQFLYFCLYQSFLQCLQYYYQSGCLYRLRALGERHNMDLTVEGFQSWMWRGLTFLLPFVFLGHFWELFNSITLFRMSRIPGCQEWQVSVCALSFLTLFLGNILTTIAVVRQKLKNRSVGKSRSD